MQRFRRLRTTAGTVRIVVVGVIVGTVVAALAGVLAGCGAALDPATVPVTAGASRFVPVGPVRVADTRVERHRLTALDATTWRLSLAGVAGLPADATAVALHLTVTDTGSATGGDGWLSARPGGVTAPSATSTLNWAAGQTVSNATVVALGPAATVDLVAAVARERFSVVVDLAGAFVPATSARAGRFVAAGSTRLLDTRLAGVPVPAGGTVVVPVPPGTAADTTALVLNLTALTTAVGHWTARPAGAALPLVSQLTSDGTVTTRAAAAIVATGPGGVAITSSAGGHLVVDLAGAFTGPSAPATSEGLFVPVVPTRVLDTRFGPSPQPLRTPIWAGGALEVDPVGTGGSGGAGPAVLPGGDHGAVVVNVTSTAPHAAGHLTTWAAGTPRPATSTLNSPGPGSATTLANLAVVPRSTRGIAVGSGSGEHVVVDVTGVFTGAARAATLPPLGNPMPDPDRDAIASPHDSCPDAAGPADPFHRGCPTPAPSTQTFGASREGRPLVVERRMGSAFPTRRVVVVGVIHGDEPAGLSVVAALRAAPLPPDLDLWLLDVANPDGLARGQRGNAAGVDLNRNFDAGWLPSGASPYTVGGYEPGPSPASEPETRAFVTLATAIVASHGPIDGVLWYHQPWDAVVCTPGDEPCETFARRVGMAAIDEPRPGSAKAWSTEVLGAASAAVVELPEGAAAAATIAAHADAVRRYRTV